jgi:hypothetical protein
VEYRDLEYQPHKIHDYLLYWRIHNW